MNDEKTPSASWFERLSQALLGEPQDREQLVNLLRDAQQRDLLDSEALGMIEGVLYICEMRVSEIMVPRSEMVVIERDQPLEEILEIVTDSGHSRFPVVSDSKDDVAGILLAKDLLGVIQNKKDRFNIRDILRTAVFVPESKRVDILLHEFRKNRNHLAVVVDEYGSVAGLVTIEDVLEQIVGEIEDEHDFEEAEFIRKHNENTYTINALTPISDFNEYFDTNFDENEFETIGGIILKAFGHLPQKGDSVDLGGIGFTILHANNRRILSLSISLPQPLEEEQE